MCIVVAKKKGIELPSMEVFENCFDNNSDGAGFMYNHNNRVIIKKGFMTFKDFKEAVTKTAKIIDTTNTGMVFHFRISTSGNVDKGNCHPYPVTNNLNLMRKTNFVTDLGMAHNGIISHYNGKDKTFNDTQLFIKEVVSYLYSREKLNMFNHANTVNIMDAICKGKLAFLDGKGNIYTIGSFVNENGVMYSNSTYSYSGYDFKSSYKYGWWRDNGSKYSNYIKPISTPKKTYSEYLDEFIKELKKEYVAFSVDLEDLLDKNNLTPVTYVKGMVKTSDYALELFHTEKEMYEEFENALVETSDNLGNIYGIKPNGALFDINIYDMMESLVLDDNTKEVSHGE